MLEHVGIIVDGNGRWAKNRGLKRSLGHKEGANNLKKQIEYIFKTGVNILSLYIFSTENFKRSDEEVNYLMDLFITMFKSDFKKYKKENIKVIFSGRRVGLNEDVLNAMDEITRETKDNTAKTINFCLNYGSCYEIVDAYNNMIKDNVKEASVELISKYMYQDLPNLDLLIRTGGEVRLSNFMLWQMAYAEMYFTNTLFPDLKKDEIDLIFSNFKSRDRRYGGINYNEGETNNV